MAGLDSIKKYADGGTTQEAPLSAVADSAPEAQGTVAYQPPKSTGIAEKLALDPTQTADILANMQKYVEEREGFIPSLARGLTRGMATAYGPLALAATDREQQLEDKQIMDYRQTMAAYKAAQAQAQRDAEEYAAKMKSGVGTSGVGQIGTSSTGEITYDGIAVPKNVQARLTSNATLNKAVIDDWLKGRQSEETKKEFSPAMSNIVKIWIPGKGEQDVTVAMAEQYLKSNPELQAIIGGQKVPAAKAIIAANTSPEGATGRAVQIASSLGIPIISGDRDWDKQYSLYLESKKPGYTGNPVAFPGTSAHQFGNAIDTLRNLPESDKAKLRAAGFRQTVANDPGHWELAGAPAAPTAPTAPVAAPTAPVAAPTAPVAAPTAPVAAPTAPTAPTARVPAPAAPVSAPAAPIPTVTTANINPSNVVSGPPEPPNPANYPSRGLFDAAKAKWEKEVDSYNQVKGKLAESGIASVKEEADKFIARTDEKNIQKRLGENTELKTIINKWGGDPIVAGTLNDPTWGNAIAKGMQKGISTPLGKLAMDDIVEVIQRAAPHSTKEQIEASQRIAQLIGQRIFDVVAQSKGSTSDKDWLAFKQIAGTADNGWDALHKMQRFEEESIKTDKAERDLFKQTYNGQTFDYSKHLMNRKREELMSNFGNVLTEVGKSHFKPQITPPRPSNVPQGAMYNPELKKWGWYDQNKKWTTN